MHNGQFVKFIEFLEKFARDNNLKLVIGEIFNKRLDKWFEKRGYIKDRDNRVYRELGKIHHNPELLDKDQSNEEE